MGRLVTREAPEFTAKAVTADGMIEELSLADYRGKYVILFFYPLDFTFVCPSEILAFNARIEDFRKKDCEVIGVSVDSEYSHFAWRNTPVDQGGIGKIDYPLVSDITKRISRSYDVLHDESVALRGLFLIDRNGIVRHELVNDLPLGRSVSEALRVLDALQHVEKHGEVCPADWRKGEEAMEPTRKGVSKYLEKMAKVKLKGGV